MNRRFFQIFSFYRRYSIQLKDNSLLQENGFIDGNWVAATSGKTYHVRNPANDDLLATVADMDQQDAQKAIAAAHAEFPSWSSKTGKERSQLIRRLYEAVNSSAEDLAKIMTLENGKPLSEARGEVTYAASFLDWFSEEAKRVTGEVIGSPLHNQRLLAIKQPVGVVGVITPWNFPLAMITRKLGAALAAGCTTVLKPAELTPLSALAIAELSRRVGIPPGVINIVPVSHANVRAVGTELTTSPIVRKISFTGSTAVGKLLLKQCSGTVKRASMELGGNAPFIVFEDADIDEAVKGAMASKFRHSGQTCVCANRFLVHESIHDEFVEKLSKKVEALVVGNGLDKDTQQGPLIHKNASERVHNLVVDAVSNGAKPVVGGNKHSLGFSFYQPTVLTNVTRDMQIVQGEIFGPVAPIMKFKDEKEALEIANDTPVGLAAYFYSKDATRIWRVATALEVGMIGVNEGIISNEVAPFGGVKESGVGREGSSHGIDEYLDWKYVCWGGLHK